MTTLDDEDDFLKRRSKNMTTPANTNNAASGSWGSPQNWTSVLSGVSKGAESGLQGQRAYVQNKNDAREAKRRTLANLMNQAMRRNANLFTAGQEYGDEMNDFQSQALQQIARGFVNALQGSTGRG